MTFIKVEQKDFVALLTINRPEGLNALNTSVLQDLSEALDTLEKDRDVRTLIVTGAGDRAFVAGADIGEMAELTREEAVSFAGSAGPGRAAALLDRAPAGHLRTARVAAPRRGAGPAAGGGCVATRASDAVGD